MEKRPVYVLGTGLSHDGSACLLKDGEIVVAIEKERITRIKHDGGNDDAAIKYCLEAENISISDLSLIVQSGGKWLFCENRNFLDDGPDGKRFIKDCNVGVPVVNLSHHLAHAYHAVGTSPFDEMAVLVIDGSGQEMNYCMDMDGAVVAEDLLENYEHLCFEKDSFYYYNKGRLQPLYKDFSPFAELWIGLAMYPVHMMHSIGDLYEQASIYCLGDGTTDRWAQKAGKLMGLAPYGRPGVYGRKIFNLKDGRVFINYDWQHEFDRPCKSYADFKKNFQYYANIAYWVQQETEEAVLYVINHRAGLCGSKNLAYSGGVALNAVINGKITRATKFENLYITPSAGDNGLAIGCAYYGWLEILGGKRVLHDGDSCFGRIYDKLEVIRVVKEHRFPSLIQTKRTIDNFFMKLSSRLETLACCESSCKLQFVIKDMNMYVVEMSKTCCRLITGGIEGCDMTIIADGSSLTRWLMGVDTFESLVEGQKLILTGNLSIAALSPYIKMFKKVMEDSVVPCDSSARKISAVQIDDFISTAARLLADGKIIGWFQEGSEFGPRALGRRSILADPRRENVRDFINLNIKLREDFRPFAPSVLAEDVSDYFHYEGESPYMLLIFKMRQEWRSNLPAVVHEDDSSRIQTVTEGWNKQYYDLLKEFKKLTGIGMLLNTSFNRRGMPIVETPLDAVNLFIESDLDNLVIGDHIVYK